jgi:hypothetical protein
MKVAEGKSARESDARRGRRSDPQPQIPKNEDEPYDGSPI